jgi:hypothetical protein
MNKEYLKWIKTGVIACLGGGVTAAIAAAMDPSKYQFPHDIGSGKLWKFFFTGAGTMLIGLLVKSPLGQKAISTFKETQEQLKDTQGTIETTKTEIKTSVTPPPKGK